MTPACFSENQRITEFPAKLWARVGQRRFSKAIIRTKKQQTIFQHSVTSICSTLFCARYPKTEAVIEGGHHPRAMVRDHSFQNVMMCAPDLTWGQSTLNHNPWKLVLLIQMILLAPSPLPAEVAYLQYFPYHAAPIVIFRMWYGE